MPKEFAKIITVNGNQAVITKMMEGKKKDIVIRIEYISEDFFLTATLSFDNESIRENAYSKLDDSPECKKMISDIFMGML